MSGPIRKAFDPGAAGSESEADADARGRVPRNGFSTERLERRLILELAGNVCGRMVLDVGCGEEDLALVLARLGADVTGIDCSAATIAAAGRRAGLHGVDIVFERASAEWLPFHPEEFDIVTAVTVLGLLEDAHCVLREMARALKPGGHLVIGEFGTWRPRATGRRRQAWPGAPCWRHARLSSDGELRERVERAGLIVETVRGVIHHPCGNGAASWLDASDSHVDRLTIPEAAFVALSARKPEGFAA